MIHKTRTKALSWLLSLALLLSLLPGMSMTAYADNETAYNGYLVTTDANKTKSGNDLTALQVIFNGKPWYIIADNSTSATEGTVTLLAADTSFGTFAFSDNYSNDYAKSKIKGALDALTASGGSFADVADAIVTNNDAGGKLYLLSTSEAQDLSSDVLKMNFTGDLCHDGEWWLRSAGLTDTSAAFVYGKSGSVPNYGGTADQDFGVRPALQLNLASVIFSSETNTFSVGAATVDVESVTLDPTTATLTVGDNETLTATVLPADATDKSVTWSSDDESVATVADGVVTAVAAGTANITVTTTDGSKTASCAVTVNAAESVSTYTITIPATLDVQNAGWNATDGISATGTLASGKKLTVTAASANSWALKSGDNSVGYNLATATGTYSSTATPASWEFSAEELNASGGTTKAMGIIVEDYSTKPAGTYTDTVTFTASVGVAKAAAETPDIAQVDCTFSPSNGTSTLSNANITTSMEYSTDSGTTWTDVTTAGSIASLAAGTVQIRVKETSNTLASEAVSITVPQVLTINELVGPYTGDKLTPEYYAGETWQALVNRYDLIKAYSNRAAFGSDGFIYDENGSSVPVTDLVDNTKTYEVQ